MEKLMATIESVMHETRVFPPSEAFSENANVSGMEAYRALCEEAEKDYEGYWGRLANDAILWKKPFTKVLNETDAPFYKWFEDGELNASYNCLDRHLDSIPEKTAIIFEADDGKVRKISYRELHASVCGMANGLKSIGIRKGDRIVIYMPMSIEAVVAMQACARIGAIHSVVFGGFSAKSLHERIDDAGAKAVITADAGMRGGRAIHLKDAVDEALAMGARTVEKVIVYKRADSPVSWNESRDMWWEDLVSNQKDHCEPEWVNAEHPLFILYTSGSTGKPKGVQHSTGGYLLGAMHDEIEEIRGASAAAEDVGEADGSGGRAEGTAGSGSDPAPVLLRLLLEATTDLARAGRGDQACRLAAAAWSVLRAPSPELAARVGPALHRLVRLASSEPVTFRNRNGESEDQSEDGARSEGDLILDVRSLVPAARHETIFAAFDALTPGQGFVLVNDHDPRPLRYQLEAEHPGTFTWAYDLAGPTEWRVHISRSVATAAV